MVKGNVFIDKEGIDVERIDVPQRNRVLEDFLCMRTEAEGKGDSFFYIASQKWEDFYNTLFTKPYWKGVDSGIVHNLQNDFHKPELIDNEDEFKQKSDPKTHGGFEYDGHPSKNYIYNIDEWRKWHYDWLYKNPQYIEWGDNILWPRLDLVVNILKEELTKQNLSIPKKDIDVANVFHDEVMKHLNKRDLRSDAIKIGSSLCESNYYHRETDLEKLEQKNGNVKAETIFSIKKEGKYQFLSIDTNHGMFELCDDKGDHLGEYRFDGTPNGQHTQESDHSLLCVNDWKKQYNK